MMMQMEIERLADALSSTMDSKPAARTYFDMVPMEIAGNTMQVQGVRECRDSWLCSMVGALFGSEMYRRRCRHRRCRPPHPPETGTPSPAHSHRLWTGWDTQWFHIRLLRKYPRYRPVSSSAALFLPWGCIQKITFYPYSYPPYPSAALQRTALTPFTCFP